jgi:hypothetical protein
MCPFPFPCVSFLWLHSHLHNSKRGESGSIRCVYKGRPHTVPGIDSELKINSEPMSDRAHSVSILNLLQQIEGGLNYSFGRYALKSRSVTLDEISRITALSRS